MIYIIAGGFDFIYFRRLHQPILRLIANKLIVLGAGYYLFSSQPMAFT
ncbi:MAG: hypothetical protein LBG46_06265 [Elusimicrobiota bacterium]|jgi:hypothetical protein|nr:hypothetical protein [Elusimicrobiota bacterium]